MSNVKEIANAVYADIKPKVEAVLEGFRGDMLRWQTMWNASYNTVQVIVKVLFDKGLVTEDEFRVAGETLMADARKNHEATQAAAQVGRRVRTDELKSMPMERAQAILNEVRRGPAKEKEEVEGPSSQERYKDEEPARKPN